MKVKVGDKEVNWILGKRLGHNVNRGPQANSMLTNLLGTELESKFVPMQLGSNSYIWEFEGDDWKKRSEASAEEENLIQAEMDNIRKRVCQKNEKAGVLLDVPNNDFIFFHITSSGEVDIKITGWGFTNSKPASGGRMEKLIDERPKEVQDIRIAFTVDGLPVPQRVFSYKLAYMQTFNVKSTESDGFFKLAGLAVGSVIDVVDTDTGRSYQLVVVSGQQDYTFDVTQYISAGVFVTQDGNPLKDEHVVINYNAKEYDLLTDVAGKVFVELPYISGYEWETKVRDARKTLPIRLDENLMEFSFVTPVTPPVEPEPPVVPEPPIKPEPPVQKDVLVSVQISENSLPLVGEQVAIVCNGQNALMLSDETGTVSISFKYTEGEEVKVIVRNEQKKQLLNENGNLFEYSFDTVPVPTMPEVKLRVEDSNGKALVGKEIVLCQGENRLVYTLDENGSCSFAADCFLIEKELKAILTNEKGEEICVSFSLEEEEYDYLLIGETKKKSSWMIVLEVVLLLSAAVSFYFLWPYFIGAAESLGKNLFV